MRGALILESGRVGWLTPRALPAVATHGDGDVTAGLGGDPGREAIPDMG
jgi:hypothetical protein